MTAQQVKKEVLEEIKEWLRQSKKYKCIKVHKAVKSFCENATENDIELVDVANIEEISIYNFRVDIYAQYNSENYTGKTRKFEPFRMSNVAAGALSYIWSLPSACKPWQKSLYVLIQETVDCPFLGAIVQNRSTELGSAMTKKLMEGAEAYYRANNETFLYNHPYRFTDIQISDIVIESSRAFKKAPLCPIVLRIKKDGRNYLLYLGYYRSGDEPYGTESIETNMSLLGYPSLLEESTGLWAGFKKTLFGGWKIITY